MMLPEALQCYNWARDRRIFVQASTNPCVCRNEARERERAASSSSSSVLHAAQHPTISESFPPSLSRATPDDVSPQTVIDDGTWETFKVNVMSRFSKKSFFLLSLNFHEWKLNLGSKFRVKPNVTNIQSGNIFMASRAFFRMNQICCFCRVFHCDWKFIWGREIQSAFSMPHVRWCEQPFTDEMKCVSMQVQTEKSSLEMFPMMNSLL